MDGDIMSYNSDRKGFETKDNGLIRINGEQYKVLSSEVKYAKSTHNKTKGYSILVLINIEHNNQKGYISFYVDFFNNNNFKNIENKKYMELPTNSDSKINLIEIFDTRNFIDFIDSEMIVEFGKIFEKEIELKLNISDELIKLSYHGFANIVDNWW